MKQCDNEMCAHCGKPNGRSPSEINRAMKAGLRLFCNRKCAGLGRRSWKTKAQKVAEKKLYDAAYRATNLKRIKARKRAYFQRTYDPIKAARERKKRMPLHVAYCRQPSYKDWKSKYDQQRRASEYGPFAEAYLLAVNLNREIKTRMSNYEIRSQNETLNKRQSRSRQAAEAPSRDRRSRT